MLWRTIKRLLVWITAIALGTLAYLYVRDPILTTRLLTLDQGPEVAITAGPPIDIAQRAPEDRAISQTAVDAAIAYGAETDSHALIVYRAGAIELEHYYPGFDAASITPTQSMHKSVLAMLIGIAIRDGYIKSIDTPAATYLKEWAEDERSRITIRQMLQQVSGIDFDSFSANLRSGFFQIMLGTDIRALTLASPVLAPPDTQFDYNSINPQALGIVLERATGMPYPEYLTEALWKHIGAPEAAVVIDSAEHGMTRTFCCLQATARSWLHLGLLHLNDGKLGGKRVVPADWMRKIRTPGRLNPNYGYLTWLGTEWTGKRRYNRKTSTSTLHSEPFAAPDVIYFDGMGGQRVYVIPSADMVIVRTGALAMDWDDSVLPNTLLRGLP